VAIPPLGTGSIRLEPPQDFVVLVLFPYRRYCEIHLITLVDREHGMSVPHTDSSSSGMRRNRRFAVGLRVRFEWAADGCPTRRGRGISRNISTCGVYLVTPTLLPVGARVQLEIEVPSLLDRRRTMRLQGEGWVVRVERIKGRSGNPLLGIAAAVHLYTESSRKALLSFASQHTPASNASHDGGKDPAHKGPTELAGKDKANAIEPEPTCRRT
jgi:hypothetical protein